MSNSGVFDVNDIRYLMDYQQWSGVGTLELIETQTISGATARINFQSLGDYDVHFMTANDMHNESDNRRIGVQFFESGVLEQGTVYEVASQFGNASDNFIEVQGTGYGSLRWGDNFGNNTNETMSGHMYFYSLSNPATYSYVTHHAASQSESNVSCMEFGSGVMKQASLVDGISIEIDSGHNFLSGTLSLYGIKYS
jgi:hypothetical protein